jgi:cytoskeletal protein CcmA (bactofilin family)
LNFGTKDNHWIRPHTSILNDMIGIKNITHRATSSGNETFVANRINNGTTFIGDITSESDIRIDGIVRGNITCKSRVVIGEQGDCKGDIVCTDLTVEGRILGTLEVNGIFYLKKNAYFEGDVHYEKLIVEEGATVTGSLTTRPLKKISHVAPLVQMSEVGNA